MNGLIGYTGFVGRNLDEQANFHKKYNSKNIETIRKEQFNLLVCAGVYGTKWIANKEPIKDLAAINQLLSCLEEVECKKIVLISTVDVYKETNNVNESTSINLDGLHSYGRNRNYVEEFINEHFENHSIIRLPALYGKYIKKNFIYDLLNSHCLHWTHRESQFQYYYLDNLWKDIQVVLKNNIRLINFTSEPIKAYEVAKVCFNLDFENITERSPENYNIQSVHSNFFGSTNGYMYQRHEVVSDIKAFIKQYK